MNFEGGGCISGRTGVSRFSDFPSTTFADFSSYLFIGQHLFDHGHTSLWEPDLSAGW